MTGLNSRTVRFLTLLLMTGALATTSQSAVAQAKKPERQSEPTKVEEPKPEAPDKPERFRRLPEGRSGIPEWTPQAGRLQQVDCSRTETVKFLPIDVYPLLPIKDDTELGGEPILEIVAKISHTAGRIFLTGHVTISERYRRSRLVWNTETAFSSNFAFDSIVHKEGCVIDKVSPSGGQIGDMFNDSHAWEKVYGAGFIVSANCRQDTSGDDEGKVGCKDIKLKPIEVSYRKADEARLCDAVQIRPRAGVIFPLSDTQSGPAPKDMDGNRVDVFLDSVVEIVDVPDDKGQELGILTNLKMAEIRHDRRMRMRAYGKGGQRNVFLTAFDAPGCRIVSVNPATGTLRGKSFEGDHEPRQYGHSDGNLGMADGLIDYAICRTDTAGEDNGKIGCTEVAYKALTIVMEPE